MASASAQPSDDPEFIWECQTNSDPWNEKETHQWTAYPFDKSAVIEQALQEKREEIDLDDNYRLNLKHYVQQNIHDPHRQRPIRRRKRRLPYNKDESTGHERFTSSIGLVTMSVTDDITYYGSPFVHKWLLKFTEGTMTVKFKKLYPRFVDGLLEEGSKTTQNQVDDIDQRHQVDDIKNDLDELHQKLRYKRSKEKMKMLQEFAATLYTKHCYVYGAVNNALRTNNEQKLDTLGPFCYVLFNFIGQRFGSISSIRDRLKQFIHPNEIQTATLYRGDRDSDNMAEQYRQAAGDDSKNFKWLPFVSTSRDRNVAERFAVDILYIIQMRYCSSNEDQSADLAIFSHYPHEAETLLLPGVQFQVTEVKYDNKKGRHLIYIRINSSYINKLR